mgnify:CR=1 FL=1
MSILTQVCRLVLYSQILRLKINESALGEAACSSKNSLSTTYGLPHQFCNLIVMVINTDLRIYSCSVLIAKPLFCLTLKHAVTPSGIFVPLVHGVYVHIRQIFKLDNNMRYSPIWLYTYNLKKLETYL